MDDVQISSWQATKANEIKDMSLLNNIKIQNSQDEIDNVEESIKEYHYIEPTCLFVNKMSKVTESKRVQQMKE